MAGFAAQSIFLTHIIEGIHMLWHDLLFSDAGKYILKSGKTHFLILKCWPISHLDDIIAFMFKTKFLLTWYIYWFKIEI